VADAAIDAFLEKGPHAVVGASRHRHKYGNKCLRAYLQREMPVYAVNPSCEEGETVEGLAVYDTLADLPEPVHGVSIITPPHVTERIVDQAIALGIEHLWMQPGAESAAAVTRARAAGISVIEGGPCLLVVLGYRESA
jgi:predicted CoA-binding protein